METAAAPPFGTRVREAITDSLRYWEPRRLIFDGVLAAVVAVHFILALPRSPSQITFDGILVLFVLAVLANVCYCAAYVVDLFVQFSGFGAAWQQRRWLLLLLGTLFAATLTHFFALGMFQK